MEIQAANHEYLSKRGYAANSANSAEQAMEMLSKRAYNCVGLDVLMPDLDAIASDKM